MTGNPITSVAGGGFPKSRGPGRPALFRSQLWLSDARYRSRAWRGDPGDSRDVAATGTSTPPARPDRAGPPIPSPMSRPRPAAHGSLSLPRGTSFPVGGIGPAVRRPPRPTCPSPRGQPRHHQEQHLTWASLSPASQPVSPSPQPRFWRSRPVTTPTPRARRRPNSRPRPPRRRRLHLPPPHPRLPALRRRLIRAVPRPLRTRRRRFLPARPRRHSPPPMRRVTPAAAPPAPARAIPVRPAAPDLAAAILSRRAGRLRATPPAAPPDRSDREAGRRKGAPTAGFPSRTDRTGRVCRKAHPTRSLSGTLSPCPQARRLAGLRRFVTPVTAMRCPKVTPPEFLDPIIQKCLEAPAGSAILCGNQFVVALVQ